MSEVSARREPPPLPPEIDRWNWGAFLLNWIWGIGNNTYVALLTLVPIVGFVTIFVLGAKGSKWAWQNGRWDSVEHFKRVQRRWAMWGVIIWLAMLLPFAGVITGVFHSLKHSEAYTLAVSRLQVSPAATAVLGTPITAGFPFGSISVEAGGTGKAELSFSATGPKAAGKVFVDAVRKDGVWSIKTMTLKVDGSDQAIDIVGGKNNST
jgi:hypothetical protein